ncbi:unnamed protein product [Durusdinium trenchii]
MPSTPFIFGMPQSDAFLKRLTACEEEAMSSLGSRMEAAYYAAPLQLVDQTLPALVRHLRSEGWAVYGATSRRTGDSVPYDWHSWLLVDFLLEHGLHFTPLSTETVHLGNATRAGGIFFVGGEEVNKGHVIHQVVPAGHMAVLIDNTYDKLLRARSSSSCRFQGVHFTAAHGLESDDESRQRWLCEQLAQIGRRCKSCGQEL